MREILFRGKRKDNNEWAFGYLFDDGMVDSDRIFIGGIVVEDYKGNADDIFDITGIGFCEVIPKTVCQYAGLTDKNGRKIFEGDILRYEKKKYAVVWLDRIAAFASQPLEDGRYSPCMNEGTMKVSEIIGNIFDNPELMDGKKVWD